MLKETTELFKKSFYLPNYNNLKIDIFSLKLFAKQIQNYYNFIRLHRNFKSNNRCSPLWSFYIPKMNKSL